MAWKRKSDATHFDEVDRTLYSIFCSAANSPSRPLIALVVKWIVISDAGVLLDDLLVAEDLAAAETTSAASHAAAAAAAANVQAGRSPGTPGRFTYADERSKQTIPEAVPDGAVVLGTPVAPPVNGDMYTDISTENAMLQGPRRLSKGVEYLVEASAAEAEAISATLFFF
ncbi:serine/threonine-protein phosphatase BSL3-like [Phoenix dactylifera]|uniref:Serine/threonine-protein phosphatase BSL3-like n=1 Tax=Phoenix dactylifera TaxID=42345 RepID=A0A8B8ZQK6_PHODC|nr:serine/threonine-protein phosphatase BSL3-like [Phoenix dactylifera]